MTDATIPRTYEPAPGVTSAPDVPGWGDESREQLGARLVELGSLEADWDSYGAVTVDQRALDKAQLLGEWALTQSFPQTQVFPLPTGGVQIEWNAGPIEVALEIDPGGDPAVFICDDRLTGQRFDGELPAGMGMLHQAISRLTAYR